MGTDTLQIRFDSHEALRSEFDKNIANRGIFVATDGTFEVRQSVTVEVILDYDEGRLDGRAMELALEGEVVHCVPVEMAANGATPGVAVQFEASAQVLRERFEPLLGATAVEAAAADSEGQKRRGARRGSVRVPVRVIRKNQAPIEMTSRDLSATGVLLSMKDSVLPVGEILRIGLSHPSGPPEVEITGKVVRHVPNKRGKVAAVAIAFDQHQVEESDAKAVLEALREAGHQSRLGGIAGSLSDLGLANMLQMFGASAPQGTIVIENEGEQGWVAFADEQLLGAELGVLSGRDALVAMLRWTEGQFQFEAAVSSALSDAGPVGSLSGAVLEAVCVIDEDKSGAPREIDADLGIVEEGEASEDLGTAPAADVVVPDTPADLTEMSGLVVDESDADDEFEIDVGEIDDLQNAFEDALRDETLSGSSEAVSLADSNEDEDEDDEFVIVVDDAESFGEDGEGFASEALNVDLTLEAPAASIETEAAPEAEVVPEVEILASPEVAVEAEILVPPDVALAEESPTDSAEDAAAFALALEAELQAELEGEAAAEIEAELEVEVEAEIEVPIELELETESTVAAEVAAEASPSVVAAEAGNAVPVETAPKEAADSPEIVELSLTDTVDESIEWADEPPPEEISIDADTTFSIDAKREAGAASSLDKTQSAILDLARAGMNVDRFFEVIPESEEQIQFALVSLVELRVLIPR